MQPLTVADLEAIRQTMSDYECHEWGLRVVAADGAIDHDEPVPPSRRWADGRPTAELLSGACAVALSSEGAPLADLRGYVLAAAPRARIMLIGGDSAMPGEDEGEIVIADAFCYWVKELSC